LTPKLGEKSGQCWHPWAPDECYSCKKNLEPNTHTCIYTIEQPLGFCN